MCNGTRKSHRTVFGITLATLCFVFITFGGLGQTLAQDHPREKHPHKVRVELREFSVSPHRTTVKAGWITFKALNTGQRNHELVIIRTDLEAVNLPRVVEPNDEEDGSSVRVPEDAVEIVDEIEAFPPGSHERKQFLLPAGHYALICNLPDHYMMGMHADFEVVP